MKNSSRSSIGTKIVLIASSFSLPIAVLVYLMVANINSGIDFAAKEVAGNAYLRRLVALIEGIQDHQVAVRRSGPGGCVEAVRPLRAEIDRRVDGLRKIDQSLGQLLQFTPEGLAKRNRQHVGADVVAREWTALAAAGCSGNAQEAARYDHLIQDLRTMIVHAGDTSNLILDPDLDSYYLMDATLLALPQTQERQARIALSGFDSLAAGKPAGKQQVEMAVHAAMLKEADLDRIVSSSETALNEDANFYGVSPSLNRTLKPALARYREAAGRFQALVARVGDAESIPVPAAEFLAAGEDARKASYAYWASAVDELDQLLLARIASRGGDRTQALAVASVALAGACLLAFLLMRSITIPLNGLVQSLGPGATLLGASVQRIAETSKNQAASPQEAEIICDELNAHAEEMRRALLELAAHVQGPKAAELVEATEYRRS